ncbi:MAG TPA: serine dehydratase [Planctomycetaceae bacterium]|nr:serine dehydratase [Planctomycetaceae bacterium]
MSSTFAVSVADVEAAAERIAPHVLTTPCLPNERLSDLVDCEVFLKCENLQHVGAFKARGATNAVLQLPSDATSGVVAHSSGNHAAALARAAKLAGTEAHIVMPENSAKIKIEAVEQLGVTPVFCEPNAESRDAVAKRIQDETGATLVHPYDNPNVIAGQGTVGLEILQTLDTVDAILAPVGGGGLLSGILTIVKARRPEIKVYAVEPEWADDAARSLDAGKILMPNRYDSIADGLRSPLGELTFPIISSLVDDILLVSEAHIRESMRLLATTGRIVAEPSGAVAFAGIRCNASLFAGQRVAAVVTGGNLDFGSCGLGR